MQASAKACTEQHRVVTAADLPLSCPGPEQILWNAHPRVYLPIEPHQIVQCPYCGTQYQWA